ETRPDLQKAERATWNTLSPAGWSVLRVFQRIGLFWADAWRQEGNRFRQLLRCRPGVGSCQSRAGFRVRLRGLRTFVVRHEPRAAQRWNRPSGGFLEGLLVVETGHVRFAAQRR